MKAQGSLKEHLKKLMIPTYRTVTFLELPLLVLSVGEKESSSNTCKIRTRKYALGL